MKYRLTITLATTLTFAMSAVADCPFMASDPQALGLAATTTSTLHGMVDEKNACSAAFTESVKSVQGLPQLISASQNPTRTLLAFQKEVNSEIARALLDPELANRTDFSNFVLPGAEGMSVSMTSGTYLDALYRAKLEAEQKLKEQAMVTPVLQQEEARAKLVTMTSNLLSAASTAMNDSNSSCAKNLSKNFGSQILTIGLGALSAASPLFAVGAAMSNVTMGAGLLSQVMDLFQKMPPRALKEFEEGNQTLSLACLYQNIVTMSCTMKESLDGGPKSNEMREKLKSQAKNIKNAPTYDAILNSKNINLDLQNIMTAVATNSRDSLGGNGSDSFATSLEEVFGSRGNKASAKDLAERDLRKFEFLDKYLSDPNEMNKLKGDEKTNLQQQLDMFVNNMAERLKPDGVTIQVRDFGAPAVNPQENFKKFRAQILSNIQRRLSEANGGDSSSILSLDDAVQIHRAVNVDANLPKIQYLKAANQKMRDYIQENNLANSPDWANLLKQIEQSDKALDDFIAWLKTNPTEFSDSAEFKKRLLENATKFKKNLVLKNGDSFEIKDKLGVLMNSPLDKFQSLVSQRKYNPDGELFANPFTPSQSQLTDFERFKVLKELHTASVETNIPLKDAHLVNETRRLFEDSSSPLRETFTNGVRNMISRMSSSPDPAIAKRMVRELCGLAYSLPARSGDNAISECRDLIPDRMKNMAGGRETPDCTYQKYLNEKTREDYFKTGIKPALPRPEGTK